MAYSAVMGRVGGLASPTGFPGPTGMAGPIGPTGPIGTGTQGPTGMIGPTGYMGPTGSGTSIGWTTIFDLDLTAQGTNNIAADGNDVVAGYTWTKANSARDFAAATWDASGITIQPTGSTDFTAGTRTIPYIYTVLVNAIPNYSGRRIRAWFYISAQNDTANNHCSVMGFAQTTGTLNTLAMLSKRGRTAGGTGIDTFQIESSLNSQTQFAAATIDSTTNVLVLEFNFCAVNGLSVWSGSYSAGWPAESALTFVTMLNDEPGFVPALESLALFMGAQRGASATAFSVTYGRVMLQAR